MDQNNMSSPVSAPMVAPSNKAPLLERISYGILLAIVFLSPVFFIPSVFMPVQFATSLLFAFGVVISAILFIVAKLKQGSFETPRPFWFLFGTLCVVPVVYLISSLIHGFSRIQFFGYTFDVSTVGFLILSFLFTFLVSVLFQSRERIFYSYLAIVLSSILVSLFLLIRIIFGAGALSFGIFTNLTATVIGSWNSVGIFFGIGAILSLLTYEMLTLSKAMKILASIALLLSLFFLAVVNFQAIWVIITVTSALFCVYRIFSTDSSFGSTISWKDRMKKVPTYSLIVFFIALIFTIWGSSIGNALSTSLSISNVDVRPTFAVTYDIAKKTIADHPIFGSGPNTFVLQWLSYKPADINSTIFWNTDFTYGVGLLPTMAMTTGLLGLLSWLVFLGIFFYFGFKSIFAKSDDVFSKYMTVSSFFISLYLWIMAIIYVPSVVIFILTFFFTGVFLATLYRDGLIRMKKTIFSENPKIGFASSLGMVVCIFGALALAYGLYQNSASLWYFEKSSYASNVSGNVADAETYLAKAISIVPYDVYYRSQVDISVAKINAVLSQDLSTANKTDVQNFFTSELSKAISAGLNARKVDPTNYLNWVSLGQAYSVGAIPQAQVTGAYDSANLAYDQALKINPQNPAINLLLARLEISHNDLKKAEQYTLTAIQQKQNYLDAYFLLTQIEVSNNNIQAAINSTTVATVIDPTNASTFFQLGLLKYNASDFTGAIDALNKSIAIAPDYANAKYFLGLSYVQTKDVPDAIKQFQDLQKTNPDNADIKSILANLLAGKSPFANAKSPATSKPEKAASLPINDNTNQ
jgi:tetratricopeptide (TPR) repeat protein/O-antigen ligase